MRDSRIKQLYKNISTKVSEINIYYAIVENSVLFLVGNCDKTTKVCLKGGHIIYLIYIILVLKNNNYVLTLINNFYCIQNYWLFSDITWEEYKYRETIRSKIMHWNSQKVFLFSWKLCSFDSKFDQYDEAKNLLAYLHQCINFITQQNAA